MSFVAASVPLMSSAAAGAAYPAREKKRNANDPADLTRAIGISFRRHMTNVGDVEVT
jgi:hypothetical protein